jgi:membrane-associated phospholipid phosphatase
MGDSPQSLTTPGRNWTPAQLVMGAAGLGLLSAAALFVDMAIAGWIKRGGLPGDLRRLIMLAEVFAWGGSVALIILTAAVLDRRSWRVVVPSLAVHAFAAGLIATSMKLLVARMRPAIATLEAGMSSTFVDLLPLAGKWPHEQAYGYGFQGFPSGHSATAVGLAIGLSRLYPHGRWLFVLLAVLACAQRMQAQAHFLSDVLAGAAVGCLVGAAYAWRAGTQH